jgi:divalent metal cation (Fe/Co/Zn/Cd) transporter
MDKKFEVKERGVVQQIVALAASVIVVGVLVMIGLNLMATTYTQTAPAIAAITDGNAKASATSAVQNSFSLVSTTTGYYTILYLAVIGGLAISAILGYLAFSMFRGGSSGGSTM